MLMNKVLCSVCGTARERPQLSLPRGRMLFLSIMIGVLAGFVCVALTAYLQSLWIASCAAVLSFILFEVYYSLKIRREMMCPWCHFDPVLYKRSPDAARDKCLKSLRARQHLVDETAG